MALNKDILGQALYEASNTFNDTDIDPADLEAKRLEWWTVLADTVINHFHTNGVIYVTTAGTASAQSGTGTIT